jgi:hypothetical protein
MFPWISPLDSKVRLLIIFIYEEELPTPISDPFKFTK